MNKKIEIYEWYRIRDNKFYIYENWELFEIRFLQEEIKWKVDNTKIQKSIINKRFKFNENKKKEFLEKFKSELITIKDFYSQKYNDFNFYSYKQFFLIKSDILHFLLNESKYFHWKYFIDNKKLIKFISWKEEYFKFFWYSENDYEKIKIFSKDESLLFNKYFSIKEWEIMLWKQVLKYKNIDKEIEKEKRKYDKYSIWRYWKQETSRSNRRKLKINLNKINDLDEIENKKIRKDSWKYT